MILVGSSDKETKPQRMSPDQVSQQVRNWDRVLGNRINIGGFFKKLPMAIGGRRESSSRLEPISEGKSGGAGKVVASEVESAPEKDGGNTEDLHSIGSVAIQTPRNYMYTTDGVEERYTSFTAECISLQNSDMTTQVDSDDHSDGASAVNKLGMTDTGMIHGSISSTLEKSSQVLPRKKTLRNILKSGFHNNEVAEECFTFDECDDLTTCLSESESDINFNPHQEEDVRDYKVGGYHPVSKGEVYYSENFAGREYIILRKLGWGHFSTVWLAKSRYNPSLPVSSDDKLKVDDKEHYVAIKFVKSSKNYTEAAEDEIKILKSLNNPLHDGDHLSEEDREYFDKYKKGKSNEICHPGAEHTLKMLDNFTLTGPNGDHVCMVFEVLGENALNLLYSYKNYFYTISKEASSASNASDSSAMSAIKFNKRETNPPRKTAKSKLSVGLSLRNNSKQASISDEENSSKNHLPANSMNAIKNKSYSGIPLNLVRQISKQMLLAIDYTHHCGVIHTDLKPENILVEIKEVNNLIKSLEDQKVAKMKDTGKDRLKDASFIARQSSDVSFLSYSGSYKRSKNSISGKYDNPIRSSKPLCYSFNSDISFGDVSFSEPKGASKSLTKTVSPKTRTFGFLKKFNNDNQNKVTQAISIKIADFGNATYQNFHFTDQIQTRQYRSPEIILKHRTWGASTDIWSIGCILFELVTGDFLFDPHEGSSFDKDEDHLAQILELLGEFPPDEFLVNCKRMSNFFKLDDVGNLRLKNIQKLKYWSLEDVFVEKYKFDKNDIEIKLITDLILKCLRFNLHERYDAGSLLAHPWLQDKDHFTEQDLEQSQHLPNNNQDVPGFTS